MHCTRSMWPLCHRWCCGRRRQCSRTFFFSRGAFAPFCVHIQKCASADKWNAEKSPLTHRCKPGTVRVETITSNTPLWCDADLCCSLFSNFNSNALNAFLVLQCNYTLNQCTHRAHTVRLQSMMRFFAFWAFICDYMLTIFSDERIYP